MAIQLYDEAVYEKIKKWVKNPNVSILKPEETERLFRQQADMNKDKPITLPLIAISRDKQIDILDTNKQPKTFNGFKAQVNSQESMLISAIPIKIDYQIDIYTRKMIEADEYVRNFVFNIINMPNVTISLPYYDTNIPHSSTIRLESQIIDNSDIKEKLFSDQFTRFTLKFSIDDAYLFSLPIKENATVESVEVDIVKKDNINEYDSIDIINLNDKIDNN